MRYRFPGLDRKEDDRQHFDFIDTGVSVGKACGFGFRVSFLEPRKPGIVFGKLTVYAEIGCMSPQRGIISYSLSSNRQNPLAGMGRSMVFNGWRRFRTQVLYWAPPLIVAYYCMNWATERYVPPC